MSLDLPIFLGHVLGSLNLTVLMTTSHVVGARDNLLSYGLENANVCFISTKPINIVMKGVYLIIINEMHSRAKFQTLYLVKGICLIMVIARVF